MPKKLKIGTRSFGSPDDRNGLGYGVLKPSGRFEPRQSGNSFPYSEKEEIDPIELKSETDVENHIRLSNKMLAYIGITDSGASAGSTPFAFVDGNMKISETLSVNMIPLPNHAGGYSSGRESFGSKKGYSKAFMTNTQAQFPNEIETYEELISTDSEDFDRDHVEMLQKKIKSILSQN
jgi:hypothetical protein